MKKKILTLMVGTMLAASIGAASAAPLTTLDDGQTNIGYDHYSLSQNTSNDSFYLEHGFSNKAIVGYENNGYGYGSHETDVYLHYKLDPNFRLIVGDRSYNGDYDKMFYGIGATTNLAPKLDGYASVTTNSISTDWQVGAVYKMNEQASLHVGYKSSNNNNDSSDTLDGLGFGINYKF